MTCSELKAIDQKPYQKTTSAERVAMHKHLMTCKECQLYAIEKVRKLIDAGMTGEQILRIAGETDQQLRWDYNDPENR